MLLFCSMVVKFLYEGESVAQTSFFPYNEKPVCLVGICYTL